MRAQCVVVATLLLGCSSEPDGPSLRMDFAASLGADGDVFAAPLPSDHRLSADGTVELAAFPNRDAELIVRGTIDLIDNKLRGFGTTSALYFSSEHALDPTSLPDLFSSVEPDASVYLVAVDRDAPDYLEPRPIDVRYLADGGPYGAAHMLSALPLQGYPLTPGTRYAAVVTSDVRTADGGSLTRSGVLDELIAGAPVAGVSADAVVTYQAAIDALTESGGIDRAVALAAFTTGDPTAELAQLTDAARGLGAPSPTTPFEALEVFDDFCVFRSELSMPVYQTGVAPYEEAGGEIPGADAPVDHEETSRIFVTIPRAPMPRWWLAHGGDDPHRRRRRSSARRPRRARRDWGADRAGERSRPRVRTRRFRRGERRWSSRWPAQQHRRRRAVPHVQLPEPGGDARQRAPVSAGDRPRPRRACHARHRRVELPRRFTVRALRSRSPRALRPLDGRHHRAPYPRARATLRRAPVEPAPAEVGWRTWSTSSAPSRCVRSPIFLSATPAPS